MLSICIPVYNFDVTSLVEELYSQVQESNIFFEIILIDDCSKEEFRQLNKSVCHLGRYVQLDANIGRSKIRNLFLQYASFEFLLFLDCDSKISRPDYIWNYVQAISDGKNGIVCGGRIFPSEPPKRSFRLRWRYGRLKESQPLEKRLKSPNRAFQTNNFLIKRGILEQIRFDERLSDYGHEDTLFGYELRKRGIFIAHIHNPVLNGDLESNLDYLQKTEKAIGNLIAISQFNGYDPEFESDITILRVYRKLKDKGFVPIIEWVFDLLRPSIKYLLISGFANLRLFDFYRLGLLRRQITLNQHTGI